MNTLLRLIQQHPRLSVAVLLGALVLGGIWWNRESPRPTVAPVATPKEAERLLSPEVELRGLVGKLQEENAALRKQFDGLAAELKDLKGKLSAPGPSGAPPRGDVKDFRSLLEPPPGAPGVPPPGGAPVIASPAPPPPPRVTILTTNVPIRARAAPPPAPPTRWLQLPAGSVVGVTLLSGVFAPVRQQNPLPVLLHLDEAPVGPNGSRVPLQGCVAVARAVGENVSVRATLQLDTLSCILPDGRAFSRPLAGWVTGDDGILGVTGVLIEREGPILARVALSGFLQGAAAALAQIQSTVTQNPLGGITTQITGNAPQYAALQGLAQIGNRMATFYEGQIQRLVPAIFVESGRTGHAIVQNGLTIEGYPVEASVPAGASPWRPLD